MERLMIFLKKKLIKFKLNNLVNKELGGFELLPHLISMLNRDLVGHYLPRHGIKIEFDSKRINIEELVLHGEAIIKALRKLDQLPKEADRDNNYRTKTNLDEYLTKRDGMEIPVALALTTVKKLTEELSELLESIKESKPDMHSYYSRRLEYYATDLIHVVSAILKVQIWED